MKRLVFILLLVVAVGLQAQSADQEAWSVTQHTIRVGGQTIPYRASAGTTMLTNDDGEPTGLLYSVAYTRTDVKDLSTRPVSFLYNGGPGSATMWLHMGAFGPRRAVTVNGEFTPPAPYGLVDNTETLLDKTDLVFIDAMGTGYSRAAGKAKEADFFGVDEDAAAFAQFIVTYLSRNGRWNSPKFLIGESYGTFRSAVLGNLLQQRYNVHLNGIDLISSVLDLSTITFADGDDRVYTYYLPSYAAVAWYFKVLKDRPASLEVLIEDARRFAAGEYAAALFKGSSLTAAEKAAMAKKLSTFTGLSEDYLMRADLRVKLGQFNAELMRSRGLTAVSRHGAGGQCLISGATVHFPPPSNLSYRQRGRDLIARFKDRYTAAMECLERDLEECVTHLRFPADHHQRIRTTNRLERLNGESRRRTKVIPRFPTERSCLTLLYASLRTASRHWRGIPMTASTLRQLQQLRSATLPVRKEEEAVA